MIKKCLAGIILGIIVSLMLVQRDTAVKDAVGNWFCANFQKMYGCSMRGRAQSLNLFVPSLELAEVSTRAIGSDEWAWDAKRFRVSFSWFHLLWYGSLDIHVAADSVRANSIMVDNQVAIMDHLKAFTRPGKTRISGYIKEIQFNDADIVIADTAHAIRTHFAWNSVSKRMGNHFKSQLYINQGDCCIDKQDYIKDLNGNGVIDIAWDAHGYDVRINGNHSCDLPMLPPHAQHCFATTVWNGDSGALKIGTTNQACTLHIVAMNKEKAAWNGQIYATFPLEYLKYFEKSCAALPISGTGKLCMQGEINPGSYTTDGYIMLENLKCAGIPMGALNALTFRHDAKGWRGECALATKTPGEVNGEWKWDESFKQGSCTLHSDSMITIPGLSAWSVPPKQGRMNLEFDTCGIAGTYCMSARNKDGARADIVGELSSNFKTIESAGTMNDLRYHIDAIIDPQFQVTSCACIDKKGSELVNLNTDPINKELRGQVNISVVRSLAHALCGFDMQGQGMVALKIRYEDMLKVHLNLENATIRLPQTYNFISGLSADCAVDIEHKHIALTDLACTLHRGEVSCDRASLHFDEEYQLKDAYIPLYLQQCLLNVNKDLFALVSGRLLYQKNDAEHAALKGSIIIDRSQMKENIFSDLFQKNLFNYTGQAFGRSSSDIALDIAIETSNPIRINTPFLETQAQVALHITNTVADPRAVGSINLTSGTIVFPYKSLRITQGTLMFQPDQIADPLIELVAKNKIKKYNVTMHIAGSLSNPHIMLESSPPLTEEQIIGLLLIGSQEESLNIVMPALVMQNVKNLVLGKNERSSTIERSFKKLLFPFKNIHLVPSFTDQTGRGGLRGAVEIDVNDRWRALVQKNFSLTEDTRFELEYLLSDDISVRGFRDERRDLGGEVEMRWKFGN